MNEVVQSFSISGRTYDNAVAESFSASMKREGFYRTKYKSERQFMESIDTYIEFYNTKRHIARSITKRQSSLNRTSMQARLDKQNKQTQGSKVAYFLF